MRIITNICAENLLTSKAFYIDLLGLNVKFESDWYIQLCIPDKAEIEFGIIQRDHQLIPDNCKSEGCRALKLSGIQMYVTFVVDDVDEVYHRALDLKVEILQEPHNEFYGQRRLLVKDPDGCMIDISTPW